MTVKQTRELKYGDYVRVIGEPGLVFHLQHRMNGGGFQMHPCSSDLSRKNLVSLAGLIYHFEVCDENGVAL